MQRSAATERHPEGGGRWAAAALLALALGCGEAGRPPTARASAAPLYLPLGDHYRSDCLLDGRSSTSATSAPLQFHWAIDDPQLRLVAGSLDAPSLTVRLLGDRATRVDLEVDDSSTGARAQTSLYVGVSVPADR